MAEQTWQQRSDEVAARAEALLNASRGVTQEYAEAAVDAEVVYSEDLRGHPGSKLGSKRWYLA